MSVTIFKQRQKVVIQVSLAIHKGYSPERSRTVNTKTGIAGPNQSNLGLK